MKSVVLFFSMLLLSTSALAVDGWAVSLGYCSEAKLQIQCQDTQTVICENATKNRRCARVPACKCPAWNAFYQSGEEDGGQMPESTIVLPEEFLLEI